MWMPEKRSKTKITEKGTTKVNRLIRIGIDGPSGAGKSTAAKLLAEDLNIDYIDTGAMYRAIALKLQRSGTDCSDEFALQELLDTTDVDYSGGRVYLDGEDVSELIRSREISELASVSSALSSVRKKLVASQQAMAQRKSLVMDGRDITTVVLPNAEYKFFLTASARVRALRRAKEYEAKGLPCDPAQIEAEINARDYRDSHREHSPLRKADDAIEIDSSDMNINEVLHLMKGYIKNQGN